MRKLLHWLGELPVENVDERSAAQHDAEGDRSREETGVHELRAQLLSTSYSTPLRGLNPPAARFNSAQASTVELTPWRFADSFPLSITASLHPRDGGTYGGNSVRVLFLDI